MANEITAGVSLLYTHPSGVTENVILSVLRDSANAGKTVATQKIGTVEEQFAFVDVTDARFIVVQNIDTTNFVQVGTAAGQYSIKLKPGDPALFPPNANALFLKANTAECKVSITVVSA